MHFILRHHQLFGDLGILESYLKFYDSHPPYILMRDVDLLYFKLFDIYNTYTELRDLRTQ